MLFAQMSEPQARIERAARDLGAAEWQVLLLVTVPLLWPALFAAFFLAFTLSWDEFIIAFLLARFDVTLPVEIWSALRTGLNPATNAVGSLVSAGLDLLVLAVELVLLRRRQAGMSASLELRGIEQRFGATTALAAVDLAMPAGAVRGAARPLGQRQDDAAFDPGRIPAAERRLGARSTVPDVTACRQRAARLRPCSRTTRCSRICRSAAMSGSGWRCGGCRERSAVPRSRRRWPW